MQQKDLLLHRPVVIVALRQLHIKVPQHLAQDQIHLCPRKPEALVSHPRPDSGYVKPCTHRFPGQFLGPTIKGS